MNAPFRWFLPLLLALSPALPGTAAAQAPVEGQDYVRIAGGEPWQPLDGQVEVVEIFSYACHVCDEFRPMVAAWARQQPDDVRVSHVPAAYRSRDPFATAFFAAEAIGEFDALHPATFDAVHRRGILARNATAAELKAFYVRLGVDPQRLSAAMDSPETARKVDAAHDFLRRSGAEGTPTVIINGTYRVQGRTLRDVLRIAGELVAAERQP